MLQAKWRRVHHTKLTAFAVLGVVALAGCGSDTRNQSTFETHGKIARDDANIFNAFFVVAAIIGIGIMAATIFAAIRFRARPGNENPVQTHGNTKLELSWTIAPAVILAIMGVFTVKMIWDQAAKPANAMEITVTAKQWWWQFEYTKVDGQTKKVVTANELHIPAGVPVWLTLKSDNVNHSFWIPQLMGTKDNIDGHLNTLQLIADADMAAAKEVDQWLGGQCKQYCGLSHADMRVRAKVDSAEEFAKWYDNQLEPWTPEQVSTFKKWDDVYTCSSCHYIQGIDPEVDGKVQDGTAAIPAQRGPNLTHLADRKSFGSAKYSYGIDPIPVGDLTQWIWDAQSHAAGEFGKPMECKEYPDSTAKTKCVGMPAFRYSKNQPMTEQQANDIATFLLSLGSKP